MCRTDGKGKTRTFLSRVLAMCFTTLSVRLCNSGRHFDRSTESFNSINKEMESILVIGSSNTDMVIKADRLPGPGETILGGDFFMNAGGKGANQAVAARRLGAAVGFICKTGDDIFGRHAMELFKKEGIHTDYLVIDPMHPSGIALIAVDKNGENSILVASGANAYLLPPDLPPVAELLENRSTVLMQLETPVETIAYIAHAARTRGIRCILNPAPACPLPESLFPYISVITPNEKEAELLTGVPISDRQTVVEAAHLLRRKGVETVIITLGANGAFVCSAGVEEWVAAPRVKAVDTTAAGDVFNGALAVALSEKHSLSDAVLFACQAAALSVTKLGAQASAPFRQELSQFRTSRL